MGSALVTVHLTRQGGAHHALQTSFTRSLRAAKHVQETVLPVALARECAPLARLPLLLLQENAFVLLAKLSLTEFVQLQLLAPLEPII